MNNDNTQTILSKFISFFPILVKHTEYQLNKVKFKTLCGSVQVFVCLMTFNYH